MKHDGCQSSKNTVLERICGMENQLLHTPEGVRDIYGEECAKKSFLQENLHNVLKSFGYQEIQTPTFEFFDVFSRQVGTTPSKELYKFFDREGNTLVLRPDITPSVARSAVKYFMEEKVPIRLCYAGNTFTNTSGYQGKLKEMTQLGAELIGDDSVAADAEIIALVVDALLKSGLKDFQVCIGQVDFFKGILEETGIDEDTEYELRELISNKNVFGVEEIVEKAGINDKLKDVILKMPELFGNPEILQQAKTLTDNKRAIEAIERLEQVYEVLVNYGVENYITFDLGMLHKYHYYSGIIFRAYTYGTGDAIVKGGRYDNLLKHFGKDAASIGFAIVIDQLMMALASQKIEIPIAHTNTLLLYEEADRPYAIKLAKHFRSTGLQVELFERKSDRTVEDYINYAKTTMHGGILYLENSEHVQIINLETMEKNIVSLEDLTKEVAR